MELFNEGVLCGLGVLNSLSLSVLCVFAVRSKFEYNEDVDLLRCSQIKINNFNR